MKPTVKLLEFPTKPTSAAVQQLYAKFQHLKQRISNSDSKRSARSIDRKPCLDQHKDSKFSKIGNFQPLPLSAIISHLSDSVKEDHPTEHNQISPNNHEQIILSFVTHVKNALVQIQSLYQTKTQSLMHKLSTADQKLNQIHLAFKDKKHQQTHQKINSSFTQNLNNTTRCHTFKSLSENTIQNHFLTKITPKDIEQRHRLQIRSIIDTYEKKINAILQAYSDNVSKSQPQNQHSGQNIFTQGQKLEELLKAKQKEIKEVNGENKKLKRMMEQAKMNFERNGQLNKLLKEQNRMLESAIEKLEAWKRQSELQKKNDECQVQKLKVELRLKLLQINKLKDQAQPASNMQSKQIATQREEIKKMHIDSIETSRSKDIKQKEHQSISQCQMQHPEHRQIQSQRSQSKRLPRSKSAVINKNTLTHIEALRRQNGLLSEVHLLEQENRILKWKKDKFQAELKKNEDDEDMMQQQLGRLNQQIRRLNAFSHSLDQCGLKLLKGESLQQTQVALLESESQLREEFFRQKEKKKRGFSLRR